MKVTIEFEDQTEAIQAMQGADWQNAMWQLDQWLRGILKHGLTDNREATECEIKCFETCREMLREAMDNNEIKFNL